MESSRRRIIDAVKELGESIEQAKVRRPSPVVAIIAKDSGTSPDTIRQLEITSDLQEFTLNLKETFCELFREEEGSDERTIELLKLQWKPEELDTAYVFGIRNTLMTGDPATGDPALRPSYYLHKGRKKQVGKYLEKNWPFTARKFAKDHVIDQIYELLAIWAINMCDLEGVETVFLQWHDLYQESEGWDNRYDCDINIFGRGEAIYNYRMIDSEEKIEELQLKAHDEAYEDALSNGEIAIDKYTDPDNDLWSWTSFQGNHDLEGPEETDQFENQRIDWNWKIECLCAKSGYCYVEDDVKGWRRC